MIYPNVDVAEWAERYGITRTPCRMSQLSQAYRIY